MYELFVCMRVCICMMCVSTYVYRATQPQQSVGVEIVAALASERSAGVDAPHVLHELGAQEHMFSIHVLASLGIASDTPNKNLRI